MALLRCTEALWSVSNGLKRMRHVDVSVVSLLSESLVSSVHDVSSSLSTSLSPDHSPLMFGAPSKVFGILVHISYE